MAEIKPESDRLSPASLPIRHSRTRGVQFAEKGWSLGGGGLGWRCRTGVLACQGSLFKPNQPASPSDSQVSYVYGVNLRSS
jgi:hypothetical protein